MALFGGGKPKALDAGALQAILNRGASNQRNLVNQGFGQTPQLSQDFESKRNALGQAFETGANQRAQTFGLQLGQVESPDFVREQQARAREIAFRDLPTAQQNIREQLGATGGLNRGVAIRALAQPTLQAAQASRDAQFQIQQDAARRNIERKEQTIETVFNTGQGAALEKLGIDKETANVLLKTGRADILDRAFALAGIEEGRTQGLLDIEQQRQLSEIAREAEKTRRKGGVFGAIGSLGGAVVGGVLGAKLGGPAGAVGGASLGSQVGGQLGAAAGGANSQQSNFTSSLALLAAAQRRRQPNPGVR